MKKSIIFCFLTAIFAIAISGCKEDKPTPEIAITGQPAANTTVTAGSISGSLSVAATVTEKATLSYQWYSNTSASAAGGTAVAGAASTTFAIPATLAGGTYYYFCEVSATGGAAAVRSSAATVTVAQPEPVITIGTQPAANTAVTAGSIEGSLTVAASVTEGATLSYQWNSNTSESNAGGTAVTGETEATFVIPEDLTAAGSPYYYFCEVSATGGAAAVRSSAATVTVAQPEPVITIGTQPAANTAVTAGSIEGSLTVAATVTEGATLSYQWYSNTSAGNAGGTVVTGATDATFVLPSTLAEGTYYYFCEVSATGGAEAVRSSVATVEVAPEPVITIEIQLATNTVVTEGGIAGSLTVAATVTEGATLSYQWYSNTSASNAGGTVVTGATDATFDLPTTLEAGTYYYFCEVSVTGGDAAVRTDVATVTVEEVVTTLAVAIAGVYTYNGAAQTPAVTVKAGATTLTATTHYTLAYSGSLTNAGTVTVTATGAGDYAGLSGSGTFTINPLATTLTVTVASGTYTYTGAAQTPAVTVQWGETTLAAENYNTPVYGANTNAGTATVNITGRGNFSGSTGAGNFTIDKRPITVWAENKEKTYWDANPALTYTVTPALYAGAPFTGALTRATGAITGGFEAVGKYNIGQGTLAADANYEITFVDGEFEIYYFKGDGASEATAYEIGRVEQLAKLAEFVNVTATNSVWGDKYYKLTADINLNNAAWTPIGGSNSTQNFRGHFDGNEKIVSGLSITSGSGIGLFGHINGGSVRNLGVEGTVSGFQYVGVLVGRVYGSSIITNCYTTGSVSGTNYVGGLASSVEGSSIINNCYASATVSGTGNTIGGLVSIIGGTSIITNCYATGAVSGNQYVGGMLGNNQSASITNCYATGAVSGTNQVGGVVGYNPGAAW